MTAKAPVKIHLGCGPVRLDGWVNVDFITDSEAEILADLSRPFPFADDSAELFHIEGMICQLDLAGARRFLHECHRILIPDGRIRLLTPNLVNLVRRYLDDVENGKRDLVDLWHHGTGLSLETETSCEVVNLGIRNVHKFMYDDQALQQLARQCSFEPIKVNYGESEVEALRGIDVRSPEDATYMYYELIRI